MIHYIMISSFLIKFNDTDYLHHLDIFIFGESRRISLLKPQSLFERPDSQISSRSDDIVYSLDVSLRPASVSPRLLSVHEDSASGSSCGDRVVVDTHDRLSSAASLDHSVESIHSRGSALAEHSDKLDRSTASANSSRSGAHTTSSSHPPIGTVHPASVQPIHRQFTASTTTSPSPIPLAYTPFSTPLHVDTTSTPLDQASCSDNLLKPYPESTGQLLTPCSDVTSNGDLDDMFNDVIEYAEIDASREIIFDANQSSDGFANRLPSNDNVRTPWQCNSFHIS